jgi:uncharacterized low-complexity protein
MPVKNKLNPLAVALGTTFAISLTASPIINAADNPFAANQLTNGGYQVADGSHDGKKAEGSCGDKKMEGEGKCGDKKAEGSCGDKKMEGEGKCGDKKAEGMKMKKEGKCGEGKCGDNKKAKEGSCGDKK